jgi:hypothetical protein
MKILVPVNRVMDCNVGEHVKAETVARLKIGRLR